jgi:hypothetical protein
MPCACFIVPRDVLMRLSQDRKLSAKIRKGLFDTAQISHDLRELRSKAIELTRTARAHRFGIAEELASSPTVTIYDCKHLRTLPGLPVPTPGSSSGALCKSRRPMIL